MDMKKINVIFIIGMILSRVGYFLVSKWGVGLTGSPYVTGMLLRGGTFVLMTLLLLFTGKFKELFKIKQFWFMLIIIGCLGFLVDVFANIGFKFSTVSKGSALLRTDVLMANFISVLILKERLNKFDWLFSVVMFVGVLLVLGINFTNIMFNPYDLFFILSAAAVTINAYIIQKTQKKYQADNDVIAYYNNLIVVIAFTVASLVTSDYKILIAIDSGGWFIPLVLAGGMAQMLVYIFYYGNLKKYPVWFIKIVLLFVPVVSAVAGILVFNDVLTVINIIGIVIVLIGAFGIIIVQKNKKRGVENVQINNG